MTISKMSSREQKALGLDGKPGEDYRVYRDIVEILPFGAFLLDNPEQEVVSFSPGDVVVIWSNTTVNPQKAIAGVNVNPELVRRGFVSAPNFYTERSGGPVSVLFKCESAVDLKDITYLVEVFSLGLAYQGEITKGE